MKTATKAASGASSWRPLTCRVNATIDLIDACSENERGKKWRNEPSEKVVDDGGLSPAPLECCGSTQLTFIASAAKERKLCQATALHRCDQNPLRHVPNERMPNSKNTL